LELRRTPVLGELEEEKTMPTDAHARKVWPVLGIVVLLIPASQLFRFFTQRSDIWWTPKPLAMPLAESTDRVEIYVRGELLQEQLRAQRLRVFTDGAAATVGVGDVTLRFNNRDRVRADQIPTLLVAALVTGVVGVFVVLSGLGIWPATRPPRQG
jgi:hypothetical protein